MKKFTPLFYLYILLILWLACQNKVEPQTTALAVSAQKLDTLIKNKGADTAALTATLTAAFALADNQANRQHDSIIAEACKLKGLALAKTKKYAEARFYYEKGLRLGRRHLAISDEIMVRCYRNMAITYYQEKEYKNALRYYDSVQIIRTDSLSLGNKIETLSQSATCYQELKDFETSEHLIKKACEMAVFVYPKPKLAALYVKYAAMLRSSRKHEAAIKYAQTAIDIFTALSPAKQLIQPDSVAWANGYFNMAYAHKELGLYALATPYYLKSIDIYRQLGNLDNQTTGLMNLSNAYRLTKQFDKAEKYLNQALDLLKNQTTLTDDLCVRKGELYAGLSEVFMDKKAYLKALNVQDSAIFTLTRYNERVNLTALLSVHQYNLLAVLTDKARAFAALNEKGVDTEGYQKALKLTDQIVQLADDIRADYFSDDAKLTLASDLKPALEKAISLCQNLHKQTNNAEYLQKAFDFVEYSRSMVLYENARLANQLPTELKAENDALKSEEATLAAKNNIEALQKYLQHKRQFREKIKALNKNQLANIADLQKQLLPNDQTAFIEYFVGDSAIFTFTLLKNDLKLFEIKKNKDFEQQIEAFRKGITLENPVRDATTFGKQSADLYDILLRGPLNNLPPTVSKLIIAPDGVLAYLPFEILIKNDERVKNTSLNGNDGRVKNPSVVSVATDFRKYDFLLKHFTISYAYSANLLLMQKQTKRHDANAVFGGFAPKYLEKDTELVVSTSHVPYDAIASRAVLTREGAYELKGAQEEVKEISDLVGGKSFANELATEGSFKREANQYRILHLAMHATTDDNDPMLSKLLFTLDPKDNAQDGDLTAAELYAMNLNADLAVLSACNTGFGTLSKGEGVMSLARAFTYAGVPATVTSLWKVPDLTTRDIMQAFYKNLKKGMDKDAALREAKLTYLKTAPESIAANPYFWAGFVPMGNMDAMDLTGKGPLSIKWILAGLSALVVGFIVFIKKKLF